MKPQLAYVPALSVILLVCLGVFGFAIYKSMEVFRKSGEAKKAIENSKEQLVNLEKEQANITTNVKADKSFQEYFARWHATEGDLSAQKVIEKARVWAEAAGVALSEGGSQEEVDAPSEAPASIRQPAGRTPMARPTARTPSARRAGGGSQVEVILTGSFQSLMKFLATAENELGSLKVTKVSFTARSSEEVRLAATLAFKVIGREAGE